MKVVEFTNGKYGIEVEKGIWPFKWKEYVDLEHWTFTWEAEDEYFRCCQADLEKAKRIYNKLDTGTKVKRYVFQD